MAKTKCAPAIWKKFGATEKVWWTEFYRSFLEEMRVNKATMPTLLTDERRKVIAHNHACLATWQMGAVMHRVFKALKGSKKGK